MSVEASETAADVEATEAMALPIVVIGPEERSEEEGASGARAPHGTAPAYRVDWAARGEPPCVRGAELIAAHRAARPHRSRSMWPPGVLVGLAKEPPQCIPQTGRPGRSGRQGRPGEWHARLLDTPAELAQLQRIRLCARMMLDHFPDNVVAAIQAVRKRQSAPCEPPEASEAPDGPRAASRPAAVPSPMCHP